MTAFLIRSWRPALALAAAAALSGCGSFDAASQRLAGVITPYKVTVVQGNFISREQVDALKPGMSRQQVREILGTPLLASVFHADRWDYVFTLKRQGAETQERKLAVYFKDDRFVRSEGDTMPTEAEFVAMLDNRRKDAKVPPLEAAEAQLKEFEARKPAAAASAPSAGTAAATTTPPAVYPPLEAPRR